MAGGNALHACVHLHFQSRHHQLLLSREGRATTHQHEGYTPVRTHLTHTHTHGSILLGTSLQLLFVSYSFVLRLLHCYHTQLVFHISLLQHFSLSFSVCLSRIDFRAALPESTARRQKKSYFIRVVNVSSRSELNEMKESFPLIWLHKTQTDS